MSLAITLSLSNEAMEILENLAGRMRLPAELPLEERIAIVIETMADSVDAAMEVATSNEGSPISMQEAINAVLNPDISTDFKMPDDVPAPPEPKQMTLQEIIEKGGMHGKSVSEPLMQEAVVLVYNSIDKAEWNTPIADRLVGETYDLLKKKLWQNS